MATTTWVDGRDDDGKPPRVGDSNLIHAVLRTQGILRTRGRDAVVVQGVQSRYSRLIPAATATAKVTPAYP